MSNTNYTLFAITINTSLIKGGKKRFTCSHDGDHFRFPSVLCCHPKK